jgi:hypothetical protein
MRFKITNNTEHPRQVMFIDGTSKFVSAGESVEIDDWELYRDEFERLKKFFTISNVSFLQIQDEDKIVEDFSEDTESDTDEYEEYDEEYNTEDGGIVE